jgi:CheY-like chemotaxis protein
VAWADPSQVEQILMNLCLNARDAMPDGGKLSIETRNVEIEKDYQRVHAWALPGRYVMLGVSDNGTGIDPAVLEHIFEPFFTTKEMGKGTGLGLATVYGIVKQHKGFIDVDSKPGEGTTFMVYLPIGDGEAKTADKVPEIALRGEQERILFAEDNRALREATEEVLQKLGYKVLVVKDGLEAVHLFEQNLASVDLLLLDVVMPGLNGPEAFTQMSRLRPEIPVIFTTGYATEINLIGTPSQVQPAILQKPYGTSVLAQKLRGILDKTKTQPFRVEDGSKQGD